MDASRMPFDSSARLAVAGTSYADWGKFIMFVLFSVLAASPLYVPHTTGNQRIDQCNESRMVLLQSMN